LRLRAQRGRKQPSFYFNILTSGLLRSARKDGKKRAIQSKFYPTPYRHDDRTAVAKNLHAIKKKAKTKKMVYF